MELRKETLEIVTHILHGDLAGHRGSGKGRTSEMISAWHRRPASQGAYGNCNKSALLKTDLPPWRIRSHERSVRP